MTTKMLFQPPLFLQSHSSDDFPIELHIYAHSSDQTAINRLRYRAFRDAGWIPGNSAREFVDRYDLLPSTYAVGAFYMGDCIGSLRLAFGGRDPSQDTMPCDSLFSREIDALNADGEFKLVEFSRMAVDPSLDNRSFRTTLYASLIRAGLILATAARTDIALIAVHSRISRFYEKMCGFEIIGHSESYGEIAEPTDLLALRFSEIDKRRGRSNAFFIFSAQEIKAAERAFVELGERRAA